MVVWGGPAIKRDVNLTRAFAKGSDNVLLVLCEMVADITPQYSAAGNSLSDAYRWIKVFQDFVQNFIIDKTKRKITGNDKLN
jgi:phage-related protein